MPVGGLVGIVAAAVGVMQNEGLDRVTMRRLAQELDTGAASLYVYLRNTAELHAAMLEQLLGQVDLSPVTARAPDRLTPEAGIVIVTMTGPGKVRRWPVGVPAAQATMRV